MKTWWDTSLENFLRPANSSVTEVACKKKLKRPQNKKNWMLQKPPKLNQRKNHDRHCLPKIYSYRATQSPFRYQHPQGFGCGCSEASTALSYEAFFPPPRKAY